eukprot:scaffold120867_cov37-Attheya_sp.AAC.2
MAQDCVLVCRILLTRVHFVCAVLVVLTPRTAVLRAGLPICIKAVACRNMKKRYFLPSKANYFGGIRYEYVMVDNGCNTLLYPFHPEVLTRFAGADFTWKINYSRGGVGAVKSRTLVVRKLSTASFCEVVLAGSDPLLSTNLMRFHLGTQSGTILSIHGKLSSGNRAKLAEFLDAIGGIVSDERRHVLLGQQLLQTVVSIQRRPLYLMCDFDLPFPTLQDVAAVDQLVEPLLGEFEEFDDLEDEDHGIDDDEECSFEEIDEEHNDCRY